MMIIVLASLRAPAQSVAGYWYGTANVPGMSTNNYMIELILKQNSTAVTGIINYYFRNSYRSLKLDGRYDAGTRQLALYNIPVPYYGSTDKLSVDCAMDLLATLRVSATSSNLIGSFLGKAAYQYTCPELTFNLEMNSDANNHDSMLVALRNFKESHQLWTPSATDTLVGPVVQQRPIQNFVVNREFSERANEVQQELELASDSISIDFYDNGEVDGDSISVFFNKQLLGANLKLSTRAIHLDLKLDSTKEVNELAMFANNLGAIPPNTALMLISDGKNRYEVRLTSSLVTNGVVRLRRKK